MRNYTIKLRDHFMLRIRFAKPSLAILASNNSSILIISQQANTSYLFLPYVNKKSEWLLALCQTNLAVSFYPDYCHHSFRYRFSTIGEYLLSLVSNK